MFISRLIVILLLLMQSLIFYFIDCRVASVYILVLMMIERK